MVFDALKKCGTVVESRLKSRSNEPKKLQCAMKGGSDIIEDENRNQMKPEFSKFKSRQDCLEP